MDTKFQTKFLAMEFQHIFTCHILTYLDSNIPPERFFFNNDRQPSETMIEDCETNCSSGALGGIGCTFPRARFCCFRDDPAPSLLSWSLSLPAYKAEDKIHTTNFIIKNPVNVFDKFSKQCKYTSILNRYWVLHSHMSEELPKSFDWFQHF